jgi:hypothetical protein
VVHVLHTRMTRNTRKEAAGDSDKTLTLDAARAYVKRWSETGRLLEEVRWRELAALDETQALRASDALLEYGRRLPLTAERREWSGLVEQQKLLHRMTRG